MALNGNRARSIISGGSTTVVQRRSGRSGWCSWVVVKLARGRHESAENEAENGDLVDLRTHSLTSPPLPPRGAVVCEQHQHRGNVARRHIARNSYYNPDEEEGEHPGCGANDETATFPRPCDEAGAGAPCQKAGGGSARHGQPWSIAASAGRRAITADAIGPLWLYYDECPRPRAAARARRTMFQGPRLLKEKNRHRMLTLRPQRRMSWRCSRGT